jgi:hypothetical protein
VNGQRAINTVTAPARLDGTSAAVRAIPGTGGGRITGTDTGATSGTDTGTITETDTGATSGTDTGTITRTGSGKPATRSVTR